MGCQGNSYAYTSLTFAENEEASPWRPYHVRHGFSPDDSAVTTSGAGETCGRRASATRGRTRSLSMLAGIRAVPRHRVAARPARRARVRRARARDCRGPDRTGFTSTSASRRASTGSSTRRRTSCARTPTWHGAVRDVPARQLGTSCSRSSRRRRSRSSSSAARAMRSGARSWAAPLDARYPEQTRRPAHRLSRYMALTVNVDCTVRRLYSSGATRAQRALRSTGQAHLMKKWRMIRGVVAIVALLTVTGIASGQSSAPARQQLTEFKLGVFPAADYTPLFVGLKRGDLQEARSRHQDPVHPHGQRRSWPR